MWRWLRTSVFASLIPKGLSSTVSDSHIALGLVADVTLINGTEYSAVLIAMSSAPCG